MYVFLPNFVEIGPSVVEILWFFDFYNWPSSPSWIFEFAKFYWLMGSRESIRTSMPNFIIISPSVAKILRFFDFLRWRSFAILDVCGACLDLTHSGCITLQNFVMINAVVLVIWTFQYLVRLAGKRLLCSKNCGFGANWVFSHTAKLCLECHFVHLFYMLCIMHVFICYVLFCSFVLIFFCKIWHFNCCIMYYSQCQTILLRYLQLLRRYGYFVVCIKT